jgi:hypothetical protein
MKKIVSILFVSFFIFCSARAQTQSGELSGRITDEKGQGIPFANVAVKKNGVLITGATTDFDGFYTIKPLDPGKYDVEVSVVGYSTSLTREITIGADRITTHNVKMKEGIEIDVVEIVWKRPLIDKEDVQTKKSVDQKEIAVMPTRSVNSIASTAGGVYQGDENKGLNIKGAREEASEYYIDGIRVRGSTNLPAPSIEELTVITGGVPARYGDATGGIINITTRGPSKNFQGGLEGITSQGMDPVGYNLINFNLTGPIFTKNKNTDSSRTLVGFFVTAEYLRQKDNNPSAIGNWRVKESVLDSLEKYPLLPSPISDAFTLRAETLTFKDLEKVKSKMNVESHNVAGAGKIDIRITDNILFSVGGNLNYNRYHDWVQRYGLMNWKNNPLYNELTWRVYGRFTHKFRGKQAPGEAEKKQSVIQNAYYSVQFDYSKVYNKYEDDDMGFKPFNYGHVGTFDVLSAPFFNYGTDAKTGKTGWILQGYTDTLVTFTNSKNNPETGNFTRHFFELAGDNKDYYRSLDLISLNGGLRNGDRPTLVHGIWFNTGRQFNGYGITANNDQFRMFVSGAFDIMGKGTSSRNKHSLEFGFEFDQRVDRSYQVTPIGLWLTMRQLTNRHILTLDTENPYFLIDGVKYFYTDPNAPAFGQNDTVWYERLNDGNQSYFDRQLRLKLGLDPDGKDFINIDKLAPETFDLKMFSPDELLNQGNPFVFYYGYDIYGKKVNSRSSFNDFFTKYTITDYGDTIFSRNIGAFRPVYTAAFIQDKFIFKDVLFNLGLRVDRFDANQKVLKDKYLLYQAYTAGEARGRLNGTIPGNIGDNYIVYVDDFQKTNPTPLGYRFEDRWFNQDGLEIIDPSIIARSSSTGRIMPYLVNPSDNIKNPGFDPNTSFKDYDPQIIVMPRVSFSFNVTDQASFFAHYDVLAQRPQNRLISTPVDWFYFENNVGDVLNNPNLKPERTIDYQLGFRQLLKEDVSAITISAFYRDLKDMIQVINVNYAYPINYLTFGNRDFGNVKGIIVDFELRKTRTSNLSLRASYTLQFAEGTGSDNTSQLNLVSSGQPNLRTIAPLSYDSRHLIAITADYTYGEGRNYNGPVIKDKQILANAGINMIIRTRSGEPYTKQTNPTPEALSGVPTRPILSGSLNGQRLPWNYRIDLRVFKTFHLNTNKPPKEGEEAKKNFRPLSLNIYLLIQNLLNTANIIRVYPYTGNPNDDGYLASPLGQQDISRQIFPESYYQLYSIYANNPNNYSLPRQVRLGAIFNF